MQSTNSISSQFRLNLAEQTLDKIAKKYVLSLLNRLQNGQLVLIEGTSKRVFGNKISGPDELEASIKIEDPSFYRKVFLRGSIGAAESYIENHWTSPNLLQVIRLMARNLDLVNPLDMRGSYLTKAIHKFILWIDDNSIKGSKKNISAHYDLSNDFFEKFLSADMMYSSAVFTDPYLSLEEASNNKLDRICKKLELSPQDHLLEIGTGWGGMAIYAATNYGCKVTTTTISEEQYAYALKRIKESKLNEKITVLKKDYRNLDGKYDKLVSIEMIEAVGDTHYKKYFTLCDQLLKPNGLMLIQAITVPDQRFSYAKNSVDFIKKYIFPGGCLPSNEIITKNISKYTSMVMIGLEDITEDYAITIKKWQNNFHENIAAIEKLGFDSRFIRMWNFYFSYCEGGFKERTINTAQFLLAKNNFRFSKKY